MAAGEEGLFERLRPLLEVLGAHVVLVGAEPGQGQLAKVLNNLLSASAIAITGEALALGVHGGLSARTLLDVFNSSSGRNTASADKFPRHVLPRTFGAGFRLELMHKDVELCLAEAGARAPGWTSAPPSGRCGRGPPPAPMPRTAPRSCACSRTPPGWWSAMSSGWSVLAVRYATLETTRSDAYYRYQAYGEPDGPQRLDYDHTGNLGRFPDAELLVPARELDFWLGASPTGPMFGLTTVERAGGGGPRHCARPRCREMRFPRVSGRRPRSRSE